MEDDRGQGGNDVPETTTLQVQEANANLEMHYGASMGPHFVLLKTK